MSSTSYSLRPSDTGLLQSTEVDSNWSLQPGTPDLVSVADYILEKDDNRPLFSDVRLALHIAVVSSPCLLVYL